MSESSDNGVWQVWIENEGKWIKVWEDLAERLEKAVELNERTFEYGWSDGVTTRRCHIDMERMTQRLVTHHRYRKIRKISIIFEKSNKKC